jgi:anthranilate synthase component II
MMLMIDNYDSFTYNLVQYLSELGQRLDVVRNDKITIAQIRKMRPQHIVISPGPGTPKDAGISMDVIREFQGAIPILGVCLGHQCIAEVFGGHIVRAKRLMHGKTSPIKHNKSGLFQGLPHPFDATRYHSLIVQPARLPKCLEVTAWAEKTEIMGLRHRTLPIWGVQFHPESIMTTVGMQLLQNFLAITARKRLS